MRHTRHTTRNYTTKIEGDTIVDIRKYDRASIAFDTIDIRSTVGDALRAQRRDAIRQADACAESCWG